MSLQRAPRCRTTRSIHVLLAKARATWPRACPHRTVTHASRHARTPAHSRLLCAALRSPTDSAPRHGLRRRVRSVRAEQHQTFLLRAVRLPHVTPLVLAMRQQLPTRLRLAVPLSTQAPR